MASRYYQTLQPYVFDKVIVAVMVNSAKTPLSRSRSALPCCGMPARISRTSRLTPSTASTVSFAKQKGATVMVRGLRAVTDFENEIQLAHTNFAMMPEIETVFLATAIKGGVTFLHHRAGGCPLFMGRMFPALCPATLKRPSSSRGKQGSYSAFMRSIVGFEDR